MQSFLNRLAKTAIAEHAETLGDLTIVLPSRRAIVFLREALKKELSNSNWLPQIISLEDFVHDLHEYTLIDDLDLLFEFYDIHREFEGSRAENFQDFMGWAGSLLHDYNEIDLHLVDAEEVFLFLTEAKALETWNLGEGELSEFQQNYLRFWKKIGNYYSRLKERLIAQNKAYQGMAFRLVAENIEEYASSFKSNEQLIFAGFNALTVSEAKIIHYLQEELNASVYWDADRYYLEDHFQEAGKFLRLHKEKTNQQFEWESADLLEGEKEINIYGISGNVGQAKLIGNLLQEKTSDNTAVVLANEELLTAVLESMPEGIDSINVTMGYPLSLSFIYSWIEQFILLFRKAEDGANSFYYKTLLPLLDHSLLKLIDPELESIIDKLSKQFQADKLIQIPKGQLAEIEEALGISIFQVDANKPLQLLQAAQAVLKLLDEKEKEQLDGLNAASLQEFLLLLQRLERLMSKNEEILDVEALLQLFRQLVAQQTVAFIGEPLSGLQIMGILESRSLDFEHIIISNVNEGTLPTPKKQNSFIPYDIKRKYGLPLHTDKDAIFAYHFYRLIQRAKKVDILYNTKIDQLDGGEMSRFIAQLLFELPSKNPKAIINHRIIPVDSQHQSLKEVEIESSPAIREKLKQHLEKGISPSAINSWLRCPLHYYYKYILGLKEEKEVSEKIEDNVIGTLVHNTLESLYESILNQPLTESILVEMQGQVEAELFHQYRQELNVKPEFGNHRLSFEVSKRFVNALLAYDLEQVKKGHEVIVLETEKELAHSMKLELDGLNSIPIRVYGKIDRIDRHNGEIRIIDYKTGGTQASDLGYSSVNTLLNGNKEKAVQLLLYRYLYEMEMKREVESGIISLRNISSGFMSLSSKSPNEDAEELIARVVEGLLTSTHFKHNTSSTYCAFCS